MNIRKKNDEIVDEIKFPSSMIKEKRYRISRDDVGPLILIESCVEFLGSLYFNNDFCDEINIFFISDLKDITLFQYMEQPRSMLCRKLERNFIEEDFEDFDYKWLPKCFTHI